MIRLTIRQVADTLGYKNYRSLYRWLACNNVPTFSDNGSRRKYILKTDFDLARLRTTISYLRNRYGESHWRNALKAHLNDDLLGLMRVIKNSQKENTTQEIEQERIEPKHGKNEMRFSEKLKRLMESKS